MRKLHRGIAAGMLSVPLTIGISGAAGAADFQQNHAVVGPGGVTTSYTSVSSGHDFGADGQIQSASGVSRAHISMNSGVADHNVNAGLLSVRPVQDSKPHIQVNGHTIVDR